jgi:hypothetical protein
MFLNLGNMKVKNSKNKGNNYSTQIIKYAFVLPVYYVTDMQLLV